MTSKYKDLEKNWKILDFLSEVEKLEIFENIETFQFHTGQKLHQIDELPPGFIRIVEGKIRLISNDENNQPFTLFKYTEGDFFGGLHLLRGPSKLYHSASTQVKVEILRAENFLNLIAKYPNFLKNFERVESWELFEVLNIKQNIQKISLTEKSKWALDYCKKNKINAIFISNPLSYENKEEKFIVSSSNIKDQSLGNFLVSPFEVNIIGRLPARLIKFNDDFNFSNINYQSEDANKGNYRDLETTKLQKDALEDWYGRLRDDGTFPIHKGNGVIDETLACLRMISRYFDMPFRKDVLRRILINQSDNSKTEYIPLPSIGAILDLLGLRSTPLTPDSEETFSRIPMPSIMNCNGHPIVLWDYKNSEVLVGDPRQGLMNYKISDLFKYIDSEQGNKFAVC